LEISVDDASPDWQAVECDYRAGLLAVDAICAARGVSRTALYARARSQGWPLRRGAKAQLPDTPGGLARRLLSALEAKMTLFEARMAQGAAAETAADSERDARTLNTLVRMFDKLTEIGMAGGADRSGAPGARATMELNAHDAGRLRDDLAQRLERLRGQLGD
jgi:hypothetical protein